MADHTSMESHHHHHQDNSPSFHDASVVATRRKHTLIKSVLIGLFGVLAYVAVRAVVTVTRNADQIPQNANQIPLPPINRPINPPINRPINPPINHPPYPPRIWERKGPPIDDFEVGTDISDFGTSAALSGNGNILAVTSFVAHWLAHVRVYRSVNDDSSWERIGQDIIINEEGRYMDGGLRVDLSAEGTILAITVPGIIDSDPGYARVYSFVDDEEDGDDAKWVQIGQDIREDEGSAGSVGFSMSLAADGKTLALQYDTGIMPSYVTIYQMENHAGLKNWTRLGQDLPSPNSGWDYGYGLALSADGRMVAIGGYTHASVYYYDSNTTLSWVQRGQDISHDNSLLGSVSLSGDGNILAVALNAFDESYSRPPYVGVYAFEKDESMSIWNQIGNDINGTVAGTKFGQSLCLSEDGKTLAIGDSGASGTAPESGVVSVYYFENEDASWFPLGNDISGEESYEFSGSALSLSADGRTIAITAYDVGFIHDGKEVNVFSIEY